MTAPAEYNDNPDAWRPDFMALPDGSIVGYQPGMLARERAEYFRVRAAFDNIVFTEAFPEVSRTLSLALAQGDSSYVELDAGTILWKTEGRR